MSNIPPEAQECFKTAPEKQHEGHLCWSQIILQEITNVISTLRRNKRWSISPSSQRYKPTPTEAAVIYDYSMSISEKRDLGLLSLSEFNSGLPRPLRYKFQEDPLIRGFSFLKSKISSVNSLQELPPLVILLPFLEVIKCGDTTGPITAAALNSVELFLTLGVIDPNHIELPAAVIELVNSVTRCKFEATDTISDEAVLALILKLLSVIIESDVGKTALDDRGVCEMIEVAFGMFFQNRISDFLRKSAHQCLNTIAKSLFTRFNLIVGSLDSKNISSLETIPEIKVSPKNEITPPEIGLASGSNNLQKLNSKFNQFGLHSIMELFRVVTSLLDPQNRQNSDSLHRTISLNLLCTAFEVGGSSLCKYISWAIEKDVGHIPKVFVRKMSSAMMDSLDPRPIISLTEASSTLVDVAPHPIANPEILPESRAGSNEDLHSALPIINTSNRNTRTSLKEQLKFAFFAKDLMSNTLCKHLFEILQQSELSFNNPPSWQTISIVNLTLKVIVDVFQSNRKHLKYQLEWFIQWCIDIIDSGLVAWDIEDWMAPSELKKPQINEKPANVKKSEIIVGEIREIILQSLYQLCSTTQLITDLYLNYDGDLTMQNNLFSKLITFLSRNSFPDATFGGPVTMATHQIISMDVLLQFLMDISSRKSQVIENQNLSTKIKENIDRKKFLIEGSALFNENWKTGIAFLIEQKFLPDPVDPSSMADFLLSNTFISKKVLGEYLSKAPNQDTLNAFVQKLGFKGKRIDEALRVLLEKFRLPGESQLIERIMDAFADRFFADMDPEKSPIANTSVTYVLAYSIIQLHTDQHNPQVRRRMTFEDYAKNVRGLNDGKDFNPEFLREIYDAIKDKEILMPEEHGGSVGFSFYWREIQNRSETYTPLNIVDKSISNYDRDMFSSIWAPIVASVLFLFDNTDDRHCFDKSIVGINFCASLASTYNLPIVFDYIIMSLAKISGVTSSQNSYENEKNGVTNQERFLNEFGRSYKSQVALILIFSIVSSSSESLLEGWDNIANILASLFSFGLLPSDIIKSEDLLNKCIEIEIYRSKSDKELELNNANRKELGIFSTLTQLLSLTPTEEEQEYKAKEISLRLSSAQHCIAKCHIGEFLFSSRYMDDNSLCNFIKALINASFDKRVSSKENISKVEARKKLSPFVTLMLTLITTIGIRNISRISLFWNDLSIYVTDLLSIAELPPHLLRVITIMLIKFLTSLDVAIPFMVEWTQIFEIIDKIHPANYSIFADQLCAGFILMLKKNPESMNLNSEKLFHYLSAAAIIPETITQSFEATSLLLNDQLISHEKYGECVDLLLSYPSSCASLISTGIIRPLGNSRKDKEPIHPLQNEIVLVSVKSLDKLYNLHKLIPSLSNASGARLQRVFFEFWLPILSGLGQQCYHPIREIRQHAFTLLQKALSTPEFEEYHRTGPENWIDCFDSVLFPLLDELLKPEIFSLDPSGMDETRLRGSALLCKIFLHFLPVMAGNKDIITLWKRILDYIQKYMSLVGKNDYLREGVAESLKNMLLVLSTQNVFQPGPVKDGEYNLWDITWEKMTPILPRLKEELFPTDPRKDEIKVDTESPDQQPVHVNVQ